MNKYRVRRHRFWAVLCLLSFVGLLLANPTPQDLEKLGDMWSDYLKYDLGFSGDYKPDFDNLELLDKLAVKGRAPKTGYDRKLFSDGWDNIGGCSMRNLILQRDLSDLIVSDSCKVLSGRLLDPYTNEIILFRYGATTSDEVQIDHVVAVSDAWQKGAQSLTYEERHLFYNDPLNLLAVGKAPNQEKSDQDAASWLPPNKKFRCDYVGRQVQVKAKYKLWVTEAEKEIIKRELERCQD